jgi:hypothetical protein
MVVTTRSQTPSPTRPANTVADDDRQEAPAATPAAASSASAAAVTVAAAAPATRQQQQPPPQQQEEDASTTPAAAAVQLQDLECAVCLGLLCEAVTTPCGHTMCRLCLVRALQRQTKCPSCRAVCVISAEDHPETLALSRLARKCFPQLYEQRLEETRQEREAMRLLLPVFFYNLPIFPGEVLRLHLFEPRYKLMMQRIVNSTRRCVGIVWVGV